MESKRDRLIELMECWRTVISANELSDPETATYYRGRLSGLKDAFLVMFLHDEKCKYVLEL